MRGQPIRMWATMMLLLLLGALPGCSSHKSVAVPQVQQYTLRTIDGHAIPYEVDRSSDGTVYFVVTDMTLSIADNHTWRSSGHRTATANGVATVQLLQDGGGYSTSGTNVRLWNDGGETSWTGTFTAQSYQLTNYGGHVYVFSQ